MFKKLFSVFVLPLHIEIQDIYIGINVKCKYCMNILYIINYMVICNSAS